MMKYKSALCIIAVSALLLGSCKKFLDINEDPNSVTELTITPELLFPQATEAVAARTASGNYEFLNKWMGYWGTSGSYAIDHTETTYNYDPTQTEGLWIGHYNILFDLYKTEKKALEKGDTVLAGAAMILSAKLWQELVDLFGNVPYTDAFENSRTTRPSYDNATDIYAKLLLRLDTAKTYVQGEQRRTFADIDLLSHGHPEVWVKLANTFKLRLLIRQSELPGFNPGPEIAKMLDGGGELNTLKAGESILINPGYVNDNSKQSPYYANYGQLPAGGDANNTARANVYFLDILSSSGDPRLNRYFRAPQSGGAITGVVYGLPTGNPLGTASSNIGAGLAASATQDHWLYHDFQSLFLEAEAIARGWAPGNAEAVYRAAVTQSFVFLHVADPVVEANDYLDNQAIADWSNSGATALSKARFIAYQKYIALAGIDPQESYSDLRRLDMIPDDGYLSVNPGRVSPNLPVRMPYPQTEYTYNGTNAQAQGAINIFTSKLFWQP